MFRMGHPLDHPLRIRPELLPKPANGAYPDPLREHARPHGSHAQRHGATFSSSAWISPKGRACSMSRSISPCTDATRAAPAGGSLPSGHRRTRAATHERGSERNGGHHASARGLRFCEGLSGPAQGRGDRRRHRSAGHRGLRAQPRKPAGAAVAGAGRGLELVSNVNGIPKGSRLAVSTNLLACLISVLHARHRPSESLTGPLAEHERRARRRARHPGRMARRLRRGLAGFRRRLAGHETDQGRARRREATPNSASAADACCRATASSTQATCQPGDPAQASGQPGARPWRHGAKCRPHPRDGHREYLLRSEREWHGRKRPSRLLDQILGACARATSRRSAATTGNFLGPIQTIIPWAEHSLHRNADRTRARRNSGDDFWGFWMLGGMSGGGMGFIVDPREQPEAQDRLQARS